LNIKTNKGVNYELCIDSLSGGTGLATCSLNIEFEIYSNPNGDKISETEINSNLLFIGNNTPEFKL
jgi:hypothetical protein